MSQPRSENESKNAKEHQNEATVSCATEYPVEDGLREPAEVASSPESPSSSSSEEAEDGDAPNQLVLYEPKGKGIEEGQTARSPHRSSRPFYSPSKTMPSIGAFTVQCASCFKWRLIPSKQRYEEIRECLLQKPFFCETAREWRPDVSCEDPTDISQDGSRLWAIDKPNIAKPPPGWQRLLHIRGEGSTKFADVYYVAPSGKRLRSMVEVQKYMAEHPEHVTEEVTLSRFSFQIPRPLRDNYVRKRPARVMDSCGDTKAFCATEAKPLTWIPPERLKYLQVSRASEPGLKPSRDPPSKKPRKSRPLSGDLNCDNNADDQPETELDKTEHSSDGS